MQRIAVLAISLLSFTSYGAEPTKRLPIPSDAEQAAAKATILDAYKADYEKAKTPAQNLELAKKLLAEALATKDDPAGRFTLLRTARDIAVFNGGFSTALESIREIGAGYDADVLQMEVEAATIAAKILRTAKDHRSFATSMCPLLEKSISADRFDYARTLSNLALSSAKEARDADLLKSNLATSRDIDRLAEEFDKLKATLNVLSARPTDPAANSAIGKFQCISKGDWHRGIPMLALGDDAQFRDVALLELDPNPDGVRIGDAWWKISDSLDADAQARVQSHAREWYRKALPGLSGITKARVEKRIGEEESSKPSTSVVSPTKPQGLPSIEGNWEESPGIIFSIKQRGDRFTASTRYKHPKAGEIEAVVNGTVTKDGKITAIFSHTKAPTDWAKNQKREAALSSDMKTISGRATFEGGHHDFVWKRQP